jgi:S1-C subfamily serine protease
MGLSTPHVAASLLGCWCLLVASAGPVSAAAGASQDGASELNGVCVLIRASVGMPFGRGAEERPLSVCENTGFFVDAEGTVLTSLMAVAGAERIEVLCVDGRRAEAEVVARDQAANLALVRTPLRETPGAARGTWSVAIGDTVFVRAVELAEGGPRGIVESGSVSAVDGTVCVGGVRWTPVVSACAAVPEGAAGAPVVDDAGQVVGVVLASGGPQDPRAGGACESTCYVLPSGALWPVVEALERGESRRLGWLGVALQRERAGLEGVRVGLVLPGEPAHAAGIRAGDILLEVDGRPIDSVDVLADVVTAAGPREGVPVKLLRGEGIVDMPVDIGPRPLLITDYARVEGSRPPRPDPAG